MKNKFLTIFDDENSSNIFSLLFYISGLILGTVLYYKFNNEIYNKALFELFNNVEQSFVSVLINKLSIYFIVFSIIILSGLCIIGFPFINIVPFVIGFISSSKIAYYFCCYGLKGIGYSVLLIIPEITLFVTLSLYTICISRKISKYLYDVSKNKNTSSELSINTYLKSYAIITVILIGICLLNSILVYLFSSIIKI